MSDRQLVTRAVSAMVAAVCGVIWSLLAFAEKKPGLMALVLIVSAVWYLASIWYFGVVGSIFLALAALFVFLGRKVRRRTMHVG